MAKLGLLQKAGVILVVCAAMAIASSAQTFSTLHRFDGTDGAWLWAGLIQATDGNLYGTTGSGGTIGAGTVFKMTPTGTLTTLYSFCSQTGCTDGSNPDAGLIQATDGNFYGTTPFGGAYSSTCAYGCGTVYRITPAGTLTTLHSFGGTDGASPYAGLIQGTDGNFYGTTWGGGTSSGGTVFEITPGGTLTTLYNFCSLTSCSDGGGLDAGLIQATDGNFYGTTTGGGTSSGGTVFEITSGGTLTTLHSFEGTDGKFPHAGLVQGTDGNFYGTTNSGGAYSRYGTIFQVTMGGTLTTLHSFRGTDGANPCTGLIQATDGNFYGTTTGGGTNQNGTVFEITAGGKMVRLYSFCAETNCSDGTNPWGTLVQATDGNFYGTTSNQHYYGPAEGAGSIFRLAAAPAVTLSPTSLNFYNQALNETSTAKTVTLKNSGTALLNISGVAIEGSGFAVSANMCGGVTLAMGKTCKVSVTFTPSILGMLTGTLTFTDNASNSPQMLSLSGTGVLPATLTPKSATYGSQTVGTTSPAKTFTLTNNQAVALTNIAISATREFAVSASTCTTILAAKSKCTINVTFTPTATGTRTGTLSVSDSANNSPQTSTLTGTGK